MNKSIYLQIFVFAIIVAFMGSFNAYAQLNGLNPDANEKQIIKKYLSGDRANYTFEEKQVINEYLKSTQNARPNIPMGSDSPDAVILAEDFDAVTPPGLPTGWVSEDTNADTLVWETAIWYPNTAPNSMRIFWNSALAMDDWFFTPALNLTAGVTYRVRFWYAASGAYNESLEVRWGTSATSGGMTGGQIFDDPLFSQSAYTEGSGTFTPTTTGTYYVGWHGYSAADQWFIVVDDIVIDEELPVPPDPAIVVNPLDAETDVSTLTTLDWAHSLLGSTETGYRINFGTDNPPTNIENNTDLGLVTTYTPAAPLAFSTTYYWEIIPYNTFGDATGTVVWSFTTASDCPVDPLPAYEDFENSAAEFPPACWSLANSTATLWDWFDNGPPNNISALANFWSFASGTEDLVSLEFSPTTDANGMLTFDWAYATCFDSPDELDIYYSTDAGATWTILLAMPGGTTGILNPFNIDYCGGFYFPLANEWSNMSLALPLGTNMVKFTAISGYGNLLWLDNIQITSELYTTSFENPPFVDQVACDDLSGYWDTWSSLPCGNEDATISTNYAHTGTQSALIDAVAPRQVDLVFLPGTKTAGKWYMNFWLYLPTGGTGYFNTQATFTVDWGMEVYFNAAGAGVLDNGTTIPFVWEEDTWHQAMMVVDLDAGMAEFWFGKNVLSQLATWDWTRGGTIPNTLDGYDFFAPTGTLTDEMYVDDFRFSDKAPPILQAADDAGTLTIDFATQVAPGTFAPTATVKNFGTATNTFDVTMTITGGYTSTKTVTALVGGSEEQVTFDDFTGSTGGPLTVTVTTALTGDEDPSNDSKDQVLYVWDDSGVWSSGSLMPGTTYLGGGASYTTTVGDATNGFIFSIGGNTDNTLRDQCWKYEVDTDTWTSIASLPSGRVILAVAAIGDYVYAIGGSDGTLYTNSVYRYDIGADTWSTVASLPGNNGWCKAVGYNDGSNDYIYLAGGYDGVGATYYNNVWVYDVTADTWSSASPMPDGLIGHALSLSGDKLVVVGGASGAGISNAVFVGTIVSPTVINWVVADSPFPGTNVESGSRYGEDLTAFVQGKTDFKWEKGILAEGVPYPPGAMYRFDAAPWGSDEIIIAGGSPTSSFTPAVPNPSYRYNPTTDTWVAHENVPTPILGSSIGTVNDGNTWKLIVASGLGTAGPDSSTQIYTQTISGGSTFAFNVSVADGWNMVSVPGTNPAGMGVDTWWSGRDAGANVVKFAGGYQVVTTTTPTEGYWMKHVGPQTYNYAGIGIVPHNDVPLALGWNLIGLYENTVAVPLTTTPPGIITAGIFEYNGGYTTATSLAAGIAYWVKADAVGSIIGLSAPPLGKDGGEAAEFFNEKWGKIILTDATGTSYTLYAVAGEVDLNRYELPPMPPAGMFDIRYGSGRIAEDLSSSQSIELSGVQYPLTVKVENMTLALQDAAGRELNSNLNPGQEVTITDNSVSKLIVLSDGLSLPTEYALEQNYPNPFNPSTTIKFALPEAADVSLSIYNTLGEKVAEVVNSRLEAGRYTYQWNAGNVATGMYIYELRTNNFVSVKKMLLLK